MANPNPSPETRFKPGESPNMKGKTSEQRRLEIENAERATRIVNKQLAALEAALDNADGAAVDSITAAINALTKSAQDRGLGTPIQTVQGTGEAGAIVFKTVYEAKPD